MVTEMVLAKDGALKSTDIYRALLKSKAKLSYEGIGAWLDHNAEPPAQVKEVPGLEAQIRLQAESANL